VVLKTYHAAPRNFSFVQQRPFEAYCEELSSKRREYEI
jgi:hypothetical protein